ncbi:MAG: type I-E CRISPR-associated protein Cas6/Cse3/CasE [Eubacteriaceae bacterium]|nr:type I-E CRISPR-associated protein Cas6/Cse3/CasE [Eubacteriaceae bacterium]
MSRIKLDIRRNETMKAISSPQVLHALIEGCFEQKNRTLWRLDSLHGHLYLLIVSKGEPDFHRLSDQLCESGETGQTKDYASFLSGIKNGQKLRFRLRGNPVYSTASTKGERGKVKPHVSEKYKREWLMKKSVQYGFELETDGFSILEAGQQKFYRNSKDKPVELTYAIFEGILTVLDADKFVDALTQGIGRGKAYGCGMMTVMV